MSRRIRPPTVGGEVRALPALGALLVSLAAILAPAAGAAKPAAQPGTQGRYDQALERAGIEPHSSRPSGTKPYAVCPPPSRGRFSCMSAVVPRSLASRRKSSLGGPLLEGSGQLSGFSPADLRSAYRIPGAGAGGVTIAITVAYDYPKAESDLATYREAYGLPPCTANNGCFEKVNQEGKAEDYPQPDSGWSAEAALDLDMASAACAECRLLLVEANDNTSANLPLAVATAANLGANVISDSWGGEESPEEALIDTYVDHPGVPVLFASGDAGYRVEYPASSPDAIAVGGTSLHRDGSARGWRESAWIGAGSGCSQYEEKPAWQTDTGCTKRSVADVSAVANPETPVSVYDSYVYEGWQLFGGTSAATPLLAGLEGLLSAAERSKGATLFWQEGPEGRLYDIAEGRNGDCSPQAEYLCVAGLGYDGPTGWGTPGAPGRPQAPFVATGEATGIDVSHATLTGALDPNGEASAYRFEYGPTSAYGTSVPVPDGDAGAGASPVGVSQSLSGLEANGLYHYRLVAVNGHGTTYGGDRTFVASPWSVQRMPRESEEEMLGVSCASPGACVAAGLQHVHFSGPESKSAPLVERLSGGEWVREAVPVYKAPGVGYGSWLEGVSCSSPGACMAVGANYEDAPGYAPLVERWEAGKWSLVPAPIPSEAQPSPLNGQRAVLVHGVACASSTSCMLVGEFTKSWTSGSAREIAALIESWDGSAWTVEPVPDQGKFDLLWSVSCASAASCVAVGQSSEAESGETSPLIERWDGSAWSIEKGPGYLNGSGGLKGVSCSSSDACMAVGEKAAERWNGSEWSSVPAPGPMRSVSCLAADWCVAVGGYRYDKGYAERWNGREWITESFPWPPDTASEHAEANGVSCVPVAGCTSVGWYYSWVTLPLAEHRGLEPDAVTQPAFVTASEAVLEGVVDPNGQGTTYHFEYDTREYKPGEGPHGTSIPAMPEGAGTGEVQVSQPLGGLMQHTTYHFRILASNGSGVTTGSDEAFTFPQPPPTVEDQAAGTVTQTTAVLNGSVNDNNAVRGSACHFVLALRSDASSPVAEPPCSPNPALGAASTPVQATATGLDPNTEYVYRVVATNAGGSTTGNPDQQLATLPNPPAVSGEPASAITQTSAVLNGHVDNEGAEAGSSCKFVIALESSPATPLAEPACAPNPVTGEASTPVRAAASGLSANTRYVYRIVAQNSGGSTTATPDEKLSTLDDPPLASFSLTTASPTAGQPVSLDASSSGDPDGTIASYSWSFGDGSFSQGGARVSHAYATPGWYTVTLTVTDGGGLTASAEEMITITAAPIHNCECHRWPLPRLSDVRITNKRFRAGHARVRAGRRPPAPRPPFGTSFRFALSVAATVQVEIARVLAGVQRHHSCGTARGGGTRKRAKRCEQTRAIGTLTYRGESRGHDEIRFTGRIGKRALRSGRYLAVLTARNWAGRSKPMHLTFLLVR